MNTDKMIAELIAAAFDSGYYQATMEKCAAKLTDEELKEYARLSQEALDRRNYYKQQILTRG